VNSVKVADHNSADVYSYDPATGQARYERHLFSQDAGDPVVHHGLLYWPFEDPRFSTGHGEYMVTNGRDWRWRMLPDGEVFHVHAMVSDGHSLFAANSGWRASLQRSDDDGRSWRMVYEHPTPAGRVTRITSLAVLHRRLYVGLTAPDESGPKLLHLIDGGLQPVLGWPAGEMTASLKAYRGWVYGVNHAGRASALWRTDATRVERVHALDGEPIQVLAAGPDALWAVSARAGGGALWRSADGRVWTIAQHFVSAVPLDVTIYGGDVYLGTQGPDERGTLWGPRAPARAEPAIPRRRLPAPSPSVTSPNVRRLLAALDVALEDPASYTSNGAGLRAALAPLALSDVSEVGAELAQRLDGRRPDLRVPLFGGALTTPATTLARWYRVERPRRDLSGSARDTVDGARQPRREVRRSDAGRRVGGGSARPERCHDPRHSDRAAGR
jgi:hypothetical protein